MRVQALLVLVLVAAGCADAPLESVDDAVPEGTLAGVIVDETIVPLPDATVTISSLGLEATTDGEGRFSFSDVEPGIYQLDASHPLYEPTTTSATVTEGDNELVRIQMVRLFDVDPFMDQVKLDGYINCGYSAGVRSPCILDYTQLVYPGGLLPILYGVSGDVRRFVVPIEEGWQQHITEMTWRPSTGTSESLSITASFYNRTSSHSYGGAQGTSPVRFQMTMDPDAEHPAAVGAEGQEDFLLFVNPHTEGSGLPVALVLEQRFEMFAHTFYYGTAADDWSFVEGDEPPF